MDEVLLMVGNTAAMFGSLCTVDLLIRECMLARHYNEASNACERMFASTFMDPPSILVLGFDNHGRSSFINTMFRVCYREEGPLLMRAQTGPTPQTTRSRTLYALHNTFLPHPETLLNLIDTPSLATTTSVDEVCISNALKGVDCCRPKMKIKIPDCVIFVAKASECCVGAPAWNSLLLIHSIISQHGLECVVVLTHKREMEGEYSMLVEDIGEKLRTKRIYCLENYRVDGHGVAVFGLRVSIKGRIASLTEDYNTRCQTLGVLKDCFRIVRRRRLQIMKANSSSKNLSPSVSQSEL